MQLDTHVNLNEIREARAAKIAAMRKLAEAETLTAEQRSEFDKLKTAITALEADEQRALFLQEAERRSLAGTDKNERNLEGRVSIMRVLQAQMEGRALSGAEAEYNQEAERRTGRRAEGAFIPMEAIERRDAVNTTTTAASITPIDPRPDQYIGALRERLVARSLGVRVLSGLRGDLSIPKYGSGLTTGWIAENAPVPEGTMTFASVSLAPRHVGGKTEMSRQLIMQSAPDIEGLVRDDLAFLIAKQIDRAILNGAGTDEPLGVLNLAGKQSGNLASRTWGDVVAFAQKLEDKEIAGGTWVSNATVRNLFATTLKETGLPGYLMENGSMAGRPYVLSRHIPADTVVLGDFSQVLLGIWSELDVLVNPYAEPSYSRGGVQIRAMATVGTACRYDEAFVIATDAAA